MPRGSIQHMYICFSIWGPRPVLCLSDWQRYHRRYLVVAVGKVAPNFDLSSRRPQSLRLAA
jgi:hypothetical protein